jgi:hypothetical protein
VTLFLENIMRLSGRRIGFAVISLSLSLLAAGCQPGSTKVTGKVVRDGQPIPVSPTGVIQVTLIPDVAPGTPYTPVIARCEPDGSFVLLEVKPGKYKIAVEQLDPSPQTDKLGGAFGKEKTPIVRDIDGKKPIEIDLAKP